ncbi:MAG: Spi family protease inhibitor [Bacteroidetes bacterium]|nr:Spi family protease inhibitor [Bacteroidota bacterium]
MIKLSKLKILTASLILGIIFYSCSKNGNITKEPIQINKCLVDEELALNVAENFFIKSNSLKSSEVKKKGIEQIHAIKDDSSKTVMYIVNYKEGGFVIVSADNRLSPILAYSDTNEFRIDAESYSSGLVEWFTLIKDKISFVRKNNLGQSAELSDEWNKVTRQMIIEDPVCEDEYEQVGSLLSTTWHQGCGFNDYMPTMTCDVPCGRAYAGCVPIAIAQVLKYHNYPTSYNWSSMPNSYGTPTTASLINDIHNSISGIHYDCDGTGVDHDYNVASVFTNYFNYSSASQSGYNRETIKQQLRLNRPVILSGGRDAGWWIFNNYTDGHM